MKASVVIGAGFGDEGKGLVTDYLASRAQCPLVVRFSGGANAGHTVQTPDGKKHVFGHIGSGTFAGAPTFLGEHFVVNPIIFKRESEQMANLGVWSKVYVDERAIITTPYDMLINQIAEAVRGAGRHGSVGVGLNETVERNLHPEFSLRCGPLGRLQKNEVRQRLTSIREDWVPGRLLQLGIHGPIDELTDSLYARLESEEILDQFMDDIFTFYCSSISATPEWLFENLKHDAIIFEGAQGLMLDQHHAWFPHVTRANTGLTNVLEMAREVGIDELDVYYLHRAYTTRHGAGPLPHELPEMPYPGIIDLTNKPNPFQGTLRLALPDLDIIAQNIAADFKSANMPAQAHLLVTCLDQVPEDVKYVKNGFEREKSKTDFLIDFENALKEVGVSPASVMTSNGPTREKIWKQRVNGKKILGAKEADYMGLDQVTHEVL